jgi:hypothetical protein
MPEQITPSTRPAGSRQEGREPVLAAELRERTADQRLEEGVGVVDPALVVEEDDDHGGGVDDRGRERAIERIPAGTRHRTHNLLGRQHSQQSKGALYRRIFAGDRAEYALLLGSTLR